MLMSTITRKELALTTPKKLTPFYFSVFSCTEGAPLRRPGFRQPAVATAIFQVFAV